MSWENNILSALQYSCLMNEFSVVKGATQTFVLHFFGEILNSFIIDSCMKADLNCPKIHVYFFNI